MRFNTAVFLLIDRGTCAALDADAKPV